MNVMSNKKCSDDIDADSFELRNSNSTNGFYFHIILRKHIQLEKRCLSLVALKIETSMLDSHMSCLSRATSITTIGKKNEQNSNNRREEKKKLEQWKQKFYL